MIVRSIGSEGAKEYDAFVAAHRHGAIEQSWAWGELQTQIPGRGGFVVLAVFAEGGEEILGSLLVIRQTMGAGKTWLWSPRGPLLPELGAEEVWRLLLGACEDLARKAGDVFLRVEPGILEAEPQVVKGRVALQSYMPENTLMVDLSVSEETILKHMTQKGRYNIKKAAGEEVYVQVGSAENLDDFYQILVETAKRDGFHLHEKDFYLGLLEKGARLYLAFHETDLLGGILVTHFGDRATYYFGASAAEKREKMAPYSLQWFAIQEAKRAGLAWYDFLGVAPEGDEKHVLAGVTQFKTRFGGVRVDYQKAQVFVFRPFWYALYRWAKAARGR